MRSVIFGLLLCCGTIPTWTVRASFVEYFTIPGDDNNHIVPIGTTVTVLNPGTAVTLTSAGDRNGFLVLTHVSASFYPSPTGEGANLFGRVRVGDFITVSRPDLNGKAGILNFGSLAGTYANSYVVPGKFGAGGTISSRGDYRITFSGNPITSDSELKIVTVAGGIPGGSTQYATHSSFSIPIVVGSPFALDMDLEASNLTNVVADASTYGEAWAFMSLGAASLVVDGVTIPLASVAPVGAAPVPGAPGDTGPAFIQSGLGYDYTVPPTSAPEPSAGLMTVGVALLLSRRARR